MTSDVAIVLGTGIKKDGSLPESCLSNVKTAVKLYQDKQVSKLIFSGKWAWNCIYTPPFTEAQAMKNLTLTLGVPESDIFTEDESVTTVSNLCNLKQNILIPNNFTSVTLVCISEVIRPRNEYNLKMVLGPDYTYDIVLAPSDYQPEFLDELARKEADKLIDCKNFYIDVTPGDHQTIKKLSDFDLQKNYLNKIKK